MALKKKFYAVKNGRKIGIFSTWAECQKQVQGFPGALFKGFVTLEEAQTYMGTQSASSTQPEKNSLDTENDCYHIYVDGSYFNNRYSWGFAVYFQGKLLHTENGVGSSVEAAKLHNVAGEVEATIQAVKWAEQEKLPAVLILHDYIGISEWAERRWKTNTVVTQEYARFMADYLGWVRFRKVSGHTGVEGNELADQLAKKALDI